jgi:translation initiation factor IF-2
MKKIARKAGAMLMINRELAANVLFEHDILSEYLPEQQMDDEVMTVIDREAPGYMDLPPRPPVVTIMGHVDHGKTTLLDTLRNANVAASESGGITQAVGAFNVYLQGNGEEEEETEGKGQRVVFVDTPGHAAFSKMRKNGAAVTDIIVLIIAATDGLQPQTIESIELAKAANIPLVVALTKIDMPGVNQETAMFSICADLQMHGVDTETVGGTVPVIPISAPQGIGLDELTETLILQAEMMELRAPTDHRGEAVVLESFFDAQQGQLIDAIVRCGTLRPGDEIIVADKQGRIRALLDPLNGKHLPFALPSTPVRIMGLKDVVPSGESLIAIADPKRLQKVLDARKRAIKMGRLVDDHKVGTLSIYVSIYSSISICLYIHASIIVLTMFNKHMCT